VIGNTTDEQQVAAVSWAAVTPPVSISEIAAAQPACADYAYDHTSSVLRVQKLTVDGQELLVDTSSGVLRPLIPAALRRRVFDAVHGLAHPGVRATTRLSVADSYGQALPKMWPLGVRIVQLARQLK
jgi:hypothetical protein